MLKKIFPFAGEAVVLGLLAIGVVGIWFRPTTVPDAKPLPEPTVERPLILPATMDAKLGRLSRLSAKSLGVVTWIVPPSVAAQFDTDEQGSTLSFVATCEGDYDLGAVCLWTPKDKTPELYGPVWVRVRAGLGPQPPPGPEPKPLPPGPTDPLTDAVKFAWQMEFAPTKAQEAAGFASVYRLGIASKALTLGTLYAEMGDKVKALSLSGKLPNVQKAINDDLNTVLPNPTTQPELTIDAESRALIARHFTRVVKALEALK
jgi:hypothetical protein